MSSLVLVKDRPINGKGTTKLEGEEYDSKRRLRQ